MDRARSRASARTATTPGCPDLTEAIERRAPALLDVGIATGWAGLYEVTPDHNALLGEAATTGGGRFLYATGFSGHGFLQGPAVGEILRDLYLGREPFVDVTPLSARAVRRRGEPAARAGDRLGDRFGGPCPA